MPCNMGSRTIFCAIFALQVIEPALKNLQRQITNCAQVVSCNMPGVNFLHNALPDHARTLFAVPVALKTSRVSYVKNRY